MKQPSMNGAGPLYKWRHKIDSIDNELVRLLNERARIACELGAVKIASGLPAYDGKRERQVLARIRAENRGPLGPESMTSIFRRVILETRRIGIWSMQQQKRKRLAVKNLK
jgi:chorismate mutase/prephenate dehydratase